MTQSLTELRLQRRHDRQDLEQNKLYRVKVRCGHNGPAHPYPYFGGCEVCKWLLSLRHQMLPYVPTDADSGDVLA